MAYEHWPYTNFHDLNLDWILGKMRELHDYVHENVDAIPEMQQDIEQLAAHSVLQPYLCPCLQITPGCIQAYSCNDNGSHDNAPQHKTSIG